MVKESEQPAPEFVPLSPESQLLLQELWAEIGVPTTTAPPPDFLALKDAVLECARRLRLPPGLMEKFRQGVASAQNDREVLDLLGEFQQLAASLKGAEVPLGGGKRARRRDFAKRAQDSLRWALSNMAAQNPTMGEAYSYLEDHKCPMYSTRSWTWPRRMPRLPNIATWKRYVRWSRRPQEPS